MSASDSKKCIAVRSLALVWAPVSLAPACACFCSASNDEPGGRRSRAAGRLAAGRDASRGRSQSTGCVACHGQTDSATMHTTGTVRLGCADCHGGNPDVMPPAGAQKGSRRIRRSQKESASQAEHSRVVAQFGQSGSSLHRVAEGDQRVHPVRQSGRPARGARRPADPPVVMPRKCSRCAPA